MDTQKLKSFIALAENLSFSEAAIQLGITQPALSQQIAELEKQMGTHLINRKYRPMKLTTSGTVLLKESYSLVAKAEEAWNKTTQAAKGYVGFLKVGFLGGVERPFLPQAIREFRAAYPKIELSLLHYDWGELNKALMREDIDVGFTMTYGFVRFPELESKKLFTDVLRVALHKSHPLASQKTIKLKDLRDEAFISLNPKTDFLLYDQTLQLCAENGFVPNKVISCWDVDSIMFNVESGLGVSIIPLNADKFKEYDINFVELDQVDRYYDLMVAWKRGSLNNSIPLFVEKLSSIEAIKTMGVQKIE